MDRALHRHARARRAGRLSAHRPRTAQGGGRNRNRSREAAGSRRAMAPVARVRRGGAVGVAVKWHAYAPSPIGDLLLVADEEGLLRVEFPPSLPPRDAPRGYGRLAPVISQLAEYFAGSRQHFDLPLALHGTPFQVEVWRALQR